MSNSNKIFIITGEASGDENGAILINDIHKIKSDISFLGIGGIKMEEKNVELLFDYSSINYIGFSSVIKNLSKIKEILNNAVDCVKKINPEIVILIDSPGFNLKFAEQIKNFYKGRIIYYISPQIWAWHKSRIKKIKKNIDRMLVVFPFEVEFYKKLNFNADYVGHPLIKKIEDFLKSNKKSESDKKRICLLPGSRTEEILRILPILANVAEVLRANYNAEINLIYPENIEPLFYKKILKGRKCNLIPNIENNHLKTLLNSDLVLTKFGTTTLELTLLNTPFISVYKAGTLNYAIAKMLTDIKYVSLPNILTGKQIVKEFIQSEMTADKIFLEAKRIFSDKLYRENMLCGFKELQDILKNTTIKQTAAEIIIAELAKSNL